MFTRKFHVNLKFIVIFFFFSGDVVFTIATCRVHWVSFGQLKNLGVNFIKIQNFENYFIFFVCIQVSIMVSFENDLREIRDKHFRQSQRKKKKKEK